MTLRVDLNCDLGEGCDHDAELMKYISSANIACGGHAGDRDMMRRTVELALENGVAIGAHPGYYDRENFGRNSQELSRDEIAGLIADQFANLQDVAAEFDASITHVKPHGALYNQAAKNRGIAASIATAVLQIDKDLVLFGLAGSHSIIEAERVGLRTASEVFADRTYASDGGLTPRSAPNALINDPSQAIGQVLDMIRYGRVRSADAIMVGVLAETVCLHGDGQHAVEFAKTVRRGLAENDIEIERFR